MCGRYSLFTNAENEELRKIIQEVGEKFPNTDIKLGEVFPTNTVPILMQGKGHLESELSVWGFPGFKNKGVVINARAETVMEKKMFHDSILARRCVIPSTGFYEWSQDGPKQKYLFRQPNKRMLYMGGIYKEFQDGQRRFVILTTNANPSVSTIHHRMPVVLSEDKLEQWVMDTDMAISYLDSPMPTLIYDTSA